MKHIMRTLTLIAVLFLSFAAQADWSYKPDVSYDDMTDKESVGATSLNDGWMSSFNCTKLRSSEYSSTSMLLAYIGPETFGFGLGRQEVIFKVDNNAPIRLTMIGVHNSMPLLHMKNPKYELIRQFKAGNSVRIRVPHRKYGTKDIEISLTGFTKSIGPVLSLCG